MVSKISKLNIHILLIKHCNVQYVSSYEILQFYCFPALPNAELWTSKYKCFILVFFSNMKIV